MQRGHAFAVLLIDVDVGRFDQDSAGLDAAEVRRQVKGRPTFAVLKLCVGSGRQEELDHLVVAVFGGHVKGTLAARVDGINDGAAFKEELGS